MTDATPPALGVALRTLRKAAGMTLDDVSRAAGVSTNYLSRAENGMVTPTAQWVQVVATAIGVHLQDAA